MWVDAWQMQCCGTPFEVGDSVSWSVIESDVDWLTAVLGSDEALTIDHAEEHHSEGADGGPTVTGVVARIRASRCRYALTGTSGYPVPGSGQLAVVERADGRDAESDGMHFNGYVVDLLPRSVGQ